jgi:hypothetical protein
MIDQRNHLSRLSGSRFAAMLSNPSAHPIPQFAAQRMRGAEAVVEQAHRRPVKVIRMVFFMLTFSERGVLDADALMRQAAAAPDTVHPQTRSNGSTVLDAQSRFVVSGGRWKPTPVLEADIRAAALGKQKCPVLKYCRLTSSSTQGTGQVLQSHIGVIQERPYRLPLLVYQLKLTSHSPSPPAVRPQLP